MIERCPRCLSDDIVYRRKERISICENCHAEYPNDLPAALPVPAKKTVPTTADKPLRIFISYPHTHRQQCELVMEHLRMRGHDVWFDSDKLHHGIDWRRGIADGIAASDLVLSFLSRSAIHRVDDVDSVCLDELRIASSIPGCRIMTVLLEPERIVKPSAVLSHRQWLDLSNWNEMCLRSEDAFQTWVEQMFRQIDDMVESQENYSFPGEITELLEKLPKANLQGMHTKLDARAFVGRKWLFDEIDAWMEDPNGESLCILYGDAGVGKSAFAAQYAFVSSMVAGLVHCAYGSDHFNSPVTIVQSIAYQLACRLPNYRSQLLNVLKKLDISEWNHQELFDQLILYPLKERYIDGGHEHLCVVIDGLDECSRSDRNQIAAMLSQRLGQMPRWLHFLITSRNDAAVRNWFPISKSIELTGERSENLDDVRNYLEEQLHDMIVDDCRHAVVEELTKQSRGVFLYAAKIMESIHAGAFDYTNPQPYPRSLSEIFHRWFDRFFPDEQEYVRRYRDIIGAIVFYPEALPERELRRIFAMTESEKEDMLRRIQVIIRRSRDMFNQPAVMIDHKYIYEWITQQEAGRFRVYREDAMAFIARQCIHLIIDQQQPATKSEAIHLPGILLAAEEQADYRCLMMNMGFAASQRAYGEEALDKGHYQTADSFFSHYLTCLDLRHCALPDLETDTEYAEALELKGDMQRKFSDYDNALTLYGQSQTIREMLYHHYGQEDQLLKMARSHRKIGNIHKLRSENDKALAHFNECQRLCEILHQGTPNDLLYRQELAIALRKSGNVLFQLSQFAECKVLFSRSQAMVQHIVAMRGTIGDRRDLSVALERLGDVARKCDDISEAMQMYKQCVDLREVIRDERGRPSDLEDLAVGYRKLANILRELKEYDAALEYYQRSIALRQNISQFHETKDDMMELAVNYRKIANILSRKDDDERALKYHEMSMELAQKLAEERGTPGDWRDYSVCFDRIGDIHMKHGRAVLAYALYVRCYELRVLLVKMRGVVSDHHDLAEICIKLADCCGLAGHGKEAAAYIQSAHRTYEHILANHPKEAKAEAALSALNVRMNQQQE